MVVFSGSPGLTSLISGASLGWSVCSIKNPQLIDISFEAFESLATKIDLFDFFRPMGSAFKSMTESWLRETYSEGADTSLRVVQPLFIKQFQPLKLYMSKQPFIECNEVVGQPLQKYLNGDRLKAQLHQQATRFAQVIRQQSSSIFTHNELAALTVFQPCCLVFSVVSTTDQPLLLLRSISSEFPFLKPDCQLSKSVLFKLDKRVRAFNRLKPPKRMNDDFGKLWRKVDDQDKTEHNYRVERAIGVEKEAPRQALASAGTATEVDLPASADDCGPYSDPDLRKKVVRIQAFVRAKRAQKQYFRVLKSVITIQVIFVYILKRRQQRRKQRGCIRLYQALRSLRS